MNYALNFAGAGHVTVPTLTGGGAAGRICRADIELANYTTQSIMGNNLSGSGSSIRIMSATSVQVRIGELSVRTITLPANSIPLNTRLVLEVFKTSAPALEVRVNGAVVGTTAISGAGGELTTNFVVNYIGIAASPTGRFVGKMYELDLFGNTFLNTDQPNASTWGTGTLVGFPTDGSQWFEYSAGGTAPTGTVTIGTITPNSTGASVPFTYSAADQTGFEYRINGGTAVTGTNSPQVVSGLTPSTAYTIEIRAINASGAGAWSASAPFTTSAAGDVTAPVFTVAPAVTSITQTGGTATAQIDEPGSIFYVVVPQAESTPSGPQVIAGQNAAGSTPIDSGSAVGTTTLSDPFTGLTAGQAYKACYIARDDEPTPNVQSSVTVVNFNAAAAPAGTITLTDFAANTAVLTGALSNITCMVLADDASGVVVIKPGLVIDGNSDLTFNDAAIVPGTWYTVVPFGGNNRAVIRVQAT